MNIAHLLPASAVFPLKKHNGRYEWALRLARLQAAAGHKVTIFAGQESSDNSSLSWRTIEPNSSSRKNQNRDLIKSALLDPSFDVFHSHFDSLGFELAHNTSRPVITTQHWFPTKEIAEKINLNPSTNAIAVPVTNYMKQENSRLGIPCSEVIHHGIDLDFFKPNNNLPKSDRLVFVGRISARKGLLETVQYIKKPGLKLDIIGKINDKDQNYWQAILPLIDNQSIRYLGPKTQSEVIDILSAAKAFIFLPNEIEAFGQTIIEAQACGTPVIINNLGANSELINPGKTGYLLDDGSSLRNILSKIDHLDPKDCIEWAKGFDITKMLRSYTDLYRHLA